MSVIIPTYNRERVLPRAIESVLSQTYKDLELIVVDDGSTDSTSRIVNSYDDPRIKFVRHTKNKNASAARNTGINHADGDYVAFLDSDDEWKKEKLSEQVGELGSRSNQWVAIYCGTDIQRTGFLGRIWEKISKEPEMKQGGAELIKDVFQLQLPAPTSSLVVRYKTVKQLSGFDEKFERHQDYEFLIRLLQRGKLAYVPEPLVNKYESGTADPKTTECAKEQYFSKYSHIINDLEDSGYDIKSAHYRQLGKLYLKQGEFKQGWHYIRRCESINHRQYIPILWSIYRGVLKNSQL